MSNSSIYGPNAWLIDEQFQQYSKDPNSVDQEWREYFEANGAPKPAAQPKASSTQSAPSAKAAQPAKSAKDSRDAKSAKDSPVSYTHLRAHET